jgi:hypothetical protein
MKTTIVAAPIGAAVLFAARTLAAAPAPAPGDLCVPQAFGVPGPQPKTPEWWNAAALGKEQRWTGAMRSDGAATVAASPPMGAVRTIWDKATRTMFLRYEVSSDSTLNPGFDRVAVALTNEAGAAALFVVFDPLLNCTGGTDANTNGLRDECEGAGRAISTGAAGNGILYATPDPVNANNWTVPAATHAVPSFAVDHAWISAVARGTSTSRLYDWTVQAAIQIPVDSTTGESGTNARTFATGLVLVGNSPVSGTMLEFSSLCNPSSPVSAASCLLASPTATTSLPDGLPAIERWKPTRTSQACNGVELQPIFVGSSTPLTSGTTPDGQPYQYPSNEIRRNSGSLLRAGIHNLLGRNLATGEVEAEFRIANWGATYADWDQATWTRIGNATLSGSLTNGRWAHESGQGTLQMTTPYTPGASISYDHQCVHVRLTGNSSGGQPVTFANDSVFRNMDLVNASVFQRFAEINIVGVTPVEQPKRVTLVVDTRNMPAQEECWKRSEGDDVGSFQQIPGCWMPDAKVPPPLLSNEKNQWGTTIDGLPTYVVHGFIDSGAKINLEGQAQIPVHVPFSAFGYHLQHQGAVNGWEHALHGATHEPDAAHNVYVLDMRPDEIHTVSTTIRAIDETTTACPAANAPKPWPDGCEAPTIPPPRQAGEVPDPKPGPQTCCATSSQSKGQTAVQSIAFIGILLALRGKTRRRRE